MRPSSPAWLKPCTFSLFMFIILSLGTGPIMAAAPSLVSYQGFLNDNVGSPLSGDYDLTFSIWDAPSDGTQLWVETHAGVTVTDGAFTVLLGSISPLSDEIFADSLRYLQISVGGEDIVPRTRLASVPFALRVGTTDGANAGTLNGPLVIKPSDFDSVGNAIQVLNNNGNPQFIITVGSDDVASVAIIEPEDSKDGRAVGSKVAQLSRNGVILFGMTEADTTAVMTPNGIIRAINSISVGQGNANSGVFANVFGFDNSAFGDSSVVSGGYANDANGFAATISGGHNNTADGAGSVISGGWRNSTASPASTVGGGAWNGALGGFSVVGGGQFDTALAQYATVAGGIGNTAARTSSTISGGGYNMASDTGATVGGGYYNKARGIGAVVAGGGTPTESDSNAALSRWATVSGGIGNIASGPGASIGGGIGNAASAASATVSGGASNTASGQYSSIAGGYSNVASGKNASIPGGLYCTAPGENSFAAGTNAHASYQGSMVFNAAWAVGSNDTIASGGNDQFVVRAKGGIYLTKQAAAGVAPYDASNLITTQGGAYLSGSGTTWTNGSDRNQKEHFEELNRQELLEKIAELPITRWNYKDDDASVTHIGPMAQDFKRLFGVGENDISISTIDPSGIALAAIQELNMKTKQLEAKSKEVDSLKAELAEVKAMLNKLLQEKR